MWTEAVAASFGHWQLTWQTGENLSQGRRKSHDPNKISNEYKAEETLIRQPARWFPVLLWRHNYNGRWSSSDTWHQKRQRYDYVCWWCCKHLRYVEDDNRLWRLQPYGTWHHRLVKIYQMKASFKVTNVRTLNLATAIIPLFSPLPPLSPLHTPTSFVSFSRCLLHFVNILLIRGSFNAGVSVGRII
jgi:hypothetical protein